MHKYHIIVLTDSPINARGLLCDLEKLRHSDEGLEQFFSFYGDGTTHTDFAVTTDLSLAELADKLTETTDLATDPFIDGVIIPFTVPSWTALAEEISANHA
jgi:hypothetical protein